MKKLTQKEYLKNQHELVQIGIELMLKTAYNEGLQVTFHFDGSTLFVYPVWKNYFHHQLIKDLLKIKLIKYRSWYINDKCLRIL